MFCKNCGKEMDDKAVVCVSCGHAVEKKVKKKFYKKWWFWLLALIIIVIAVNSGGKNASNDGETGSPSSAITYEAVNLGDLFETLEGNAMSAEEKYHGKYVEFKGEISNFDSDGNYISVREEGADVWALQSIMCYIKNDEQKQVLLNKKVGDAVTVRGKVKSVGEILGFSLDMDTIE